MLARFESTSSTVVTVLSNLVVGADVARHAASASVDSKPARG